MEEQTNQTDNIDQQDVPNATAVLVLGIISIVTCCCYGIVGLACGIIALVLASKAMDAYNANPAGFTEKSFKNMKAGRICAIIGVILSALYLVYTIVILSMYGTDMMNQSPWDQIDF